MYRTRFVVAALLLSAAACSSNETPTSTAADDAAITSDIASVAADAFAEDVDVMTGMDGSIGNTPAELTTANALDGWDFRPGLTGCSFANGSFTCPAMTRGGLSITRTITFLDASGAAESSYDSLLTASIHLLAEISGDRTFGPWSAEVDRHRDLTITGLAGTETSRTVNGTGNETVTRSRVTRNDSTRSYDVTGTSVITNVVMPVRENGTNGWPVSGTITRSYTITVTSGPNTGRTVTRTVTITFDGTQTPSGSVNGQHFTFDCAAHTAAPQG